MRNIVVEADMLDRAIQSLAAQSGVEILFAPEVAGGRRSRRIIGRLSAEEALQRLLQDTGLRIRKFGGALLVLADDATQPEDATPDILITGRRTQNVDIRRTRNDVQPYRVQSRRELLSSHADTVDQYLRTRLTGNAVSRPPSLEASGGNRSQVNLHGLGANQTLVLVDGQRMPSSMSTDLDLSLIQPDINGIPLTAIERIETLTGTAGAIYGPGAIGGVVNIILRRDYRGLDAEAGFGFSSRGDSGRGRLNITGGFTPDGGDTDVAFTFSRSETQGLRAGDRNYAGRLARLAIAAAAQQPATSRIPFNGLVFSTLDGRPLALDADRGGSALSSNFTYLPLEYRGDRNSALGVLIQNAGTFPEGLAPDAAGEGRSLLNETETTTGLLNLRHRFGHGVETFVDVIRFRDEGASDGPPMGGSPLILGGSSPINPFQQTIAINFPQPGRGSRIAAAVSTSRVTAGIIAQLPSGWKAEASMLIGVSRNFLSQRWSMFRTDLARNLAIGKPEAMTGLVADPFGDWPNFQAALDAYREPTGLRIVTRGALNLGELRLAGPLFEMPAGEATLTALGERRAEHSERLVYELGSSGNISLPFGFAQTTWSSYGELRLPVVPRDAGTLLRGAEIQAAVRYDSIDIDLVTSESYARHQEAIAFTLGGRFFPSDRLMLRASLATGILPPTPAQLTPNNFDIRGPFGSDPKRPGRQIGEERGFRYLGRGSPNLRSERARTFSVGAVLNPDGGGVRLSLDYRHIVKTDEIVTDFGSIYFLVNEELFPGRIKRAALTDADRAAGYTGGVVEVLDNTSINIGRTYSDTVDLSQDMTWRVSSLDLRTYSGFTWSPSLKRLLLPTLPTVQYVSYANGPLKWRANLGVDVTGRDWSAGLNAQYYYGYYALAAISDAATTPSPQDLARPGVRVPAQLFLDAYAAYSFNLEYRGAKRRVEFRVGLENLFDQAPAFVSGTPTGYSYYGDPRGRRAEISLHVML